LSTAGIPPISTVGTPGVHGAIVAGMHGIGVSTPRAAAVADATTGLARLIHIPNDMIFTMGTWSWMFAAGWSPARVRLVGSTTNELGAIPMLHWSIAPFVT